MEPNGEKRPSLIGYFNKNIKLNFGPQITFIVDPPSDGKLIWNNLIFIYRIRK